MIDGSVYSWNPPKGRREWRVESGCGKGHVVCWIVRTRTIDRHIACFLNFITPMSTVQTPRGIPDLRFRVLIIGRANAGKTSILQRVCETTESPIDLPGRKEEVRGPIFVCESDLTAD
jgi:hypothetical protein